MENERPTLSPDMIEELCRRYRESERSRAIHFERCEVRFAPQYSGGEQPALRIRDE